MASLICMLLKLPRVDIQLILVKLNALLGCFSFTQGEIDVTPLMTAIWKERDTIEQADLLESLENYLVEHFTNMANSEGGS